MSGVSVFLKACPCGGDIEWFWYDSDCRGNDGGHDIRCLGCGRKYEPDEARPLIKGKKR